MSELQKTIKDVLKQKQNWYSQGQWRPLLKKIHKVWTLLEPNGCPCVPQLIQDILTILKNDDLLPKKIATIIRVVSVGLVKTKDGRQFITDLLSLGDYSVPNWFDELPSEAFTSLLITGVPWLSVWVDNLDKYSNDPDVKRSIVSSISEMYQNIIQNLGTELSEYSWQNVGEKTVTGNKWIPDNDPSSYRIGCKCKEGPNRGKGWCEVEDGQCLYCGESSLVRGPPGSSGEIWGWCKDRCSKWNGKKETCEGYYWDYLRKPDDPDSPHLSPKNGRILVHKIIIDLLNGSSEKIKDIKFGEKHSCSCRQMVRDAIGHRKKIQELQDLFKTQLNEYVPLNIKADLDKTKERYNQKMGKNATSIKNLEKDLTIVERNDEKSIDRVFKEYTGLEKRQKCILNKDKNCEVCNRPKKNIFTKKTKDLDCRKDTDEFCKFVPAQESNRRRLRKRKAHCSIDKVSFLKKILTDKKEILEKENKKWKTHIKAIDTKIEEMKDPLKEYCSICEDGVDSDSKELKPNRTYSDSQINDLQLKNEWRCDECDAIKAIADKLRLPYKEAAKKIWVSQGVWK